MASFAGASLGMSAAAMAVAAGRAGSRYASHRIHGISKDCLGSPRFLLGFLRGFYKDLASGFHLPGFGLALARFWFGLIWIWVDFGWIHFDLA